MHIDVSACEMTNIFPPGQGKVVKLSMQFCGQIL